MKTMLREKELEKKKEVDEETYAKMVEQENLNKDAGMQEARNIDDAISILNTNSKEIDSHPEKLILKKLNTNFIFNENNIKGGGKQHIRNLKKRN